MILHDHPGYIDFLLWPHLHQQLRGSWKHYESEDLVRTLIRGFQVHNADIDPQYSQLTLENGELQLSKAFERVLADDSNFCMQPYLFTRPPSIARGGSLVVSEPPAAPESFGCPTHTVGGVLDTDGRQALSGHGVWASTSPSQNTRYLQGSITSAISQCPQLLDHDTTQSSETVFTDCIEGNSLAWDDMMAASSFSIDAVGEF
ncbi:hypothetical protein BO82DRAFT_181927 [Aspergillus uvarum CBS 121591]|uniref:Uncharacterized protein n=1 Tax=Aspergillus uvarum CBS 121591 TaxID=1448315 RepID=A0A319E2A0_9EURO|nr:hypothetical protein BO82DRAFT_181927 [Aspergillus uvarum CBS 121591]PYH85242.1 hypothetical protein BO82DRAFT_181927 [Aspergillus uvarum CBS 121591]